MNNKLVLLLISVFMLGLVWISIVPLFHTPDEQAHLGQVAFMVEMGRIPDVRDKYDLTNEILISERLLGTERDNSGNNKFTFHPEYRLEYTGNFIGKYEASISALTNTDAKKTFVREESSRYPVLYYIPAQIIYNFFYNQDIFTRVFFIRIWSLIIFIGTVFITYKLGQLIYHKNSFFALVLAILVAFQPMMMFANIGVNSDALGNLLFTLFLYLSLKIIQRVDIKIILFYFLTIILSIYTKPQFIITIPLMLLLFLIVGFGNIKNKKKFILIFSGLSIFILLILYNLRSGPASIIWVFFKEINIASLIKFTYEYSLPHSIKEVLPWYWGIYNWLGVTYPRIIHRIINRILVLAGIGFLFWIIKTIRSGNWKNKQIQSIAFLILTSFIYFISISFYDWLSWYTSTYPLGVQGRYFFPVISTHMLILLIGVQTLFSIRSWIQEWGIKILGCAMIILNGYGLYTVAKAYYDLSSNSSFIIQVSQYKPWFIKGNYFVFLLIITILITLFGVIIPLLYSRNDKNIQNK